ncbi:MAG: hypothetical protein AAFR61_05225 [Bacteroidota bacterium]
MSTIKPSQYLRSTNTLYWALFGGVMIFLLVAIFLVQSQGPFADDMGGVLLYVAIGLGIMTILMANFVPRQFMAQIDTTAELEQKLSKYMSPFLLKFALLEGGALFAIVVYLLTGDQNALIVALVLMGYFLLERPTRDRMVQDLELTPEEQKQV